VTTTTVVPPRPSRTRSLVFAFLGLPILALLGFFWLEIPDSHIWQLAFSVIAGSLLALAFVWLISGVVRSLRNAGTPCARWLSALLVAFWMLIKWLVVAAVSGISDNASERAGYIVSKQSAPTGAVFTYERLIAWQHDLVLLLLWIIIPALLTPFFIESVSCGIRGGVWRVAARVLCRWKHWLAIIVCDVAVYWLTGKLTGWRPSHSVHGELISLVLRLCFCYVADFLLITLLLAIDSQLLTREHACRNPAAEPTTNAV